MARSSTSLWNSSHSDSKNKLIYIIHVLLFHPFSTYCNISMVTNWSIIEKKGSLNSIFSTHFWPIIKFKQIQRVSPTGPEPGNHSFSGAHTKVHHTDPVYRYNQMKVTSALFKLVLQQCRRDSSWKEADSVAKYLLNKDSKMFWKEVKNMHGNKSLKVLLKSYYMCIWDHVMLFSNRTQPSSKYAPWVS